MRTIVQYRKTDEVSFIWNNIEVFLLIPISILFELYLSYLYLELLSEYSDLLSYLVIISIDIVLKILFLIGNRKRRYYAWQCIIILIFYRPFIFFTLYGLITNHLSTLISETLVLFSLSLIEYFYYKKRELIYINNVIYYNSNLRNKIFDGNKNGIYCRKCGTLLESDAMYCRFCGKRVIR